jgi:serine protease Do
VRSNRSIPSVACWAIAPLLAWCFIAWCLAAVVPIGANAQEVDIDLEEQAIRSAVEQAAQSVVRIETLGGRERVGELLVSEGPTTGLVISDDGYIVSSSFNFLHEPASILVTTPSGNRAAAKIVARDKARLLVLLKIEVDEKLPVPEIAPRGEMQVGQYAIAVGRTLDARQPNISVGVLSALTRIWGRAIQTDAKISPANYGGPLIDIRGRVLGILTPLMPQGEGEAAGLQWYDSGIGFAAPLEDWLPRLETLKAGTDLAAGVMGIAMKPGDIYALPAEVTVAQINAPAYRAGVRAGDRIIEADGQAIERQVQLRHVLGRRYAGDAVQLVLLRESERIDAAVELVEKLEPYEYPMLGILPLRGATGEGVTVRYVFPDSPASAAGIEPGDRITRVQDDAVDSLETLQQLVAAHDREQPFHVVFVRGDETKQADVKLVSLTAGVPDDLPSTTPENLPEAGDQPELGLIDLKLPEEKNDCFAYVPQSYHSAVPHGLLVWLAPPGQFDRAEVEKRWRDFAEEHRFIVISPRPGEAGRWNPGEVAVIRKFIDNALQRYTIDEARVVVHGRQVSGTVAWFTALANRNLVRGVAVVDAPLPPRASVENDPVNRLHVLSFRSSKSPTSEAVAAGEKRLSDAKVPLVTRQFEEERDMNDQERELLLRWLDSLDRT